MRTVTFFSYQGGVGRSLVLANTARYLSLLGQRVVVVDLDLEAPSLHWALGAQAQGAATAGGLLGLLAHFTSHGALPASLQPFLSEVTAIDGAPQPLRLLGAAGPVTPALAGHLSGLPSAAVLLGIGDVADAFVAALQQAAAETWSADFLLIDARPGAAALGGQAAITRADDVVCVMRPNVESVRGSRAVLDHLRFSPRSESLPPQRTHAVLSELASNLTDEQEHDLVGRVRRLLAAPVEVVQAQAGVSSTAPAPCAPSADDDTVADDTPADAPLSAVPQSELFVLHADAPWALQGLPTLATGDQLTTPGVLRDYLRFFNRLLPDDTIESSIGARVREARDRVWVDPAAAQRQLEEIARMCPHPASYEALLQLYGVRKSPLAEVVRVADALEQLSGSAADEAIWRVLQPALQAHEEPLTADELDLTHRVWLRLPASAPDWWPVGARLAAHLDYTAGHEILERLSAEGPSTSSERVELINLYARYRDATGLRRQLAHLSAADVVPASIRVALMRGAAHTDDGELVDEMVGSGIVAEQELQEHEPTAWAQWAAARGAVSAVEDWVSRASGSLQDQVSKGMVKSASDLRSLWSSILEVADVVGASEQVFDHLEHAIGDQLSDEDRAHLAAQVSASEPAPEGEE